MGTNKKQNYDLVIVESPAKAKTIEGFLNNKVKVLATYGHLIDLPKNKLGVDIKHGYSPEYVLIKGKSKVIKSLKSELKKANKIYLASDPDREGESIAWQVVEYFKLPKTLYERAVFHEITKPAIKKALEETKDIDMQLVEAQQTRRILDRLIGYPLSELLWHKIRYGLSAGRVQSAALRLIVEREEHIKNFIPEEFIELVTEERGIPITVVDSKGKTLRIPRKDANKLNILPFKTLNPYTISQVILKDENRSPLPPFDTATLQQEANRRFGFSAKTTMRLAQELYQGVDLPGIGRKGLITYMRTDSYALSNIAIKKIRHTIQNKYGKDALSPTIRVYKTKSKVAQEAHEAIRPTHFELDPEKLKDKLSPMHYKLYSLIWKRTLQTQMQTAVFTTITYKFTTENKEINTILKTLKANVLGKHTLLKTPGFLALEGKKADTIQPVFKENEEIKLKFKDKIFQTKPKARFTDASLVRMLKKLGIGRPSTYATIISILKARGYSDYEGRYIKPTDLGILVLNFLRQYFPEIVDYELTANIENQLDAIANGKSNKQTILESIYPKFKKQVEKIEETVKKEDVTVLETSTEPCPICGKNMVIKMGKYGKFYSCPDYPECKGIKPYIDRDKYIIPAEAEDGTFVLRSGPYGMFWAHKDYPKIKKTMPLLLKETCPKCGANLVERRTKGRRPFIGCSNYPNCKFIKK